MDPLGVLKDFIMRKDLDSVKLVGEEYCFGDEFKFPRHVETSYRSKQGSLYTLDSLVFFVKNGNLKHVEYMQQARGLKLQIVTFTDRKPLQDFLEGRIKTTDAIELLPPGAGLQHREDWPKKHSADEENEATATGEHVALSKKVKTEIDGPDTLGPYVPEAPGKTLMDMIKERERPVRDRESILICHNKNFASVLALLNRRDEEKRRVDDQQKKESDKPATDTAVTAPSAGTRYSNVEEKRFWKDHLGTDAAEELGIDPSQSFADSIKPKDASSKPKPDPRSARSSHHSHHRPAHSLSSSRRPDGPPIILVPSASQTMLNTFNVKEFLEDCVYISPEVKAKTMPKKPENITIIRKMGREHPVKYEVRDKPSVLSSKDWERVVAVFVLGKEWQFKDWPFKDHVEIFNKLLGIFLRFEDDSVESAKTVKQWNVKILSLSKHKRHQDKTAVLAFWESLDKSIRARRMNIVF